jgi:hypothetical protein
MTHTADARVDGSVTLVDVNGAEVWHGDQVLTPGTSRTLDLALVIPPVAPGSYALRVMAQDGAHTASRDVAISIR